VKKFKNERITCYDPAKFEDISRVKLGHVIDCIGLSADFRTRPFDTVEAHVCRLIKILRDCKFDSFLYLSSTRIYGIKRGVAKEGDIMRCQPLNPSDLYDISKIMGESLCFASGKENIRVARLSNVYGYDSKSENFIFTLIRDALHNGKIVLNTTFDSSKDHISVDDVVRILPEIAMKGKYKIYNVATSKNITAGQIVNKLSELTYCSFNVSKDAGKVCYPKICIDRVKEEFAFSPSSILDDLEGLVEKYKEK
jgi:nucleoside-diphosphate-sugar epimerase